MSPQLTDKIDEEFATCLDNLESSEAPRRRQAITLLERLGGIRALQVATALTSDVDPVVAASSRRICSVLSKKGLMLRSCTETQPLARTVSINSFWQLLDEVVFIIRRNLSGIAFDSFLFSIPKLSLVTIFFLSPFFTPLLELMREFWLVSLLIFVYQIFWRPLVWHSTGLACLAGFPDNTCRRQARKAGGWELYKSLMKTGLVEAILYSLLLSMIYSSYFSLINLGLPLLLVAFIWLMVWVVTLYLPPAVIFRQSVKTKSTFSSGHSGSFRVSIKFGIILILLYFIVFGSAMSSLFIFDLGNWFTSSLPFTVTFGFLIAADAVIDPFVIAYRLLLARLSLDPRQL